MAAEQCKAAQCAKQSHDNPNATPRELHLREVAFHPHLTAEIANKYRSGKEGMIMYSRWVAILEMKPMTERAMDALQHMQDELSKVKLVPVDLEDFLGGAT